MASSMKVVWLVCTVRPRALTTPVVRVDWKPKGLPMARTFWPTWSAPESPKDNFDGLGAFDDVEIGEDVAAGINHKTGAGAFDGDRVHEEIIFRCLGENVGHGRGRFPVDAHVDRFIAGQGSIALRDRGGRTRTGERQGFDVGGLAGTESRAGPVGA